MVVTNKLAPNIEPIVIAIPESYGAESSPPLDPSLPATIAVMTSGAPFPKATNVIPANDSDILNN